MQSNTAKQPTTNTPPIPTDDQIERHLLRKEIAISYGYPDAKIQVCTFNNGWWLAQVIIPQKKIMSGKKCTYFRPKKIIHGVSDVSEFNSIRDAFRRLIVVS